MKGTTIYRRILAVSFLLLYAFIYMPVQLWHQHAVIKENSSPVKITKYSVGSSSEDCKICQHTYTAYINDNCRFEINIPELLYCNPVSPVAELTCRFIDKASNKGPPLL